MKIIILIKIIMLNEIGNVFLSSFHDVAELANSITCMVNLFKVHVEGTLHH